MEGYRFSQKREEFKRQSYTSIDEFLQTNNRFPNQLATDHTERRLAQFLGNRKAAVRNGSVFDWEIEKLASYDHWRQMTNPLFQTKIRNTLLKALEFCEAHGRTPTNNSRDPSEMTLAQKLVTIRSLEKSLTEKDKEMLREITEFRPPTPEKVPETPVAKMEGDPLIVHELRHVANAILQALEVIRDNAGQPKIRWLSVEDLAQEMGYPDPSPMVITYYKAMLNPKGRRRESRAYFHPDDVRRFAGVYRVRYCAIPVKDGTTFPRLIDRPKEGRKEERRKVAMTLLGKIDKSMGIKPRSSPASGEGPEAA